MTNEQTLEKPFRLDVAADRLAVSYKTAWRLVRDGALGAFKIRGQWFLRDSDLKTYEEKQRARQGEESP
jgi:excisionase family DNA binding protein